LLLRQLQEELGIAITTLHGGLRGRMRETIPGSPPNVAE
jgi:hypothetical protein